MPRAGYSISLPWITLTPSLAACREHLANAFVATSLTEAAAGLSAAHVWDVGHLALSLGGRLGGSLLHEQFMTTGVAPSRSQAAASFALVGGGALRVAPGLDRTLDLDLASYLFRRQQASGDIRWATPLAFGGGLGLAQSW